MTSSPTAEHAQSPDWSALAPTEEARELAATARGHFAALRVRERDRAAPNGRATPDLMHELIDAGYPQIGLPEALGGIGTFLDLVVLLEEAGRALLPAPLSSTCASMQLLLRAGLGQEQELGRNFLAFGAGGGSLDATSASCDELTVLGGCGAAQYVLLLGAPGGLQHVVAVDPLASGVMTSAVSAELDPSLAAVRVRLDSAEVTGKQSVPSASLAELLAPARICLAAELLGVASGALDAAVDHVKSRQQFGKSLGAFQVVKHQLADAYVNVEKTRSLVRGCALATTDQPLAAETTLLASLTLATAIRTATDTARRYIQLLGAMGVTDESDAHLYLRRAHQIAHAVGPASKLFAQAAEMQRSAHV